MTNLNSNGDVGHNHNHNHKNNNNSNGNKGVSSLNDTVQINTSDSSYYCYKNDPENFKSKDSDEKIEKKFKQRIDNLPSGYRDQVENEKDIMYNEYIKLLDWSIQTSDTINLTRAIALFTNTYMELKYPLTKSQYENLIHKTFKIFSLYQNDTETSISISTLLIFLLLKGKRIINISIDWRVLYDIYKSNYKIDQSKTIIEENGKYKGIFNKLVLVSKPFFKVEAFEEIHNEIKEYLVPHSNYIFFALNVLTLFLPTHHLNTIKTVDNEVPLQIQEYLAIWNWIDSVCYWDEKWTDLFARFIKYGQHFNWIPLSTTIYTMVTRILDVAIGTPTMSHVKPQKLKVPDFFKSDSEAKYKYSCMGKILTYLINSKGDTLNLLKNLISKISIYFHPSNQGDWSNDLAEFLLTLCHSISKKYNIKAFDKKIVYEFIEIVYQPLLNTLYSKKKNFILSACKVIKDLAYIAPNSIFPKILESFYASFESEEEVNRVISGIEIISTCLHPLIASGEEFPEGKSHIFSIMELAISALNENYTNKASAAFKLYHRLFTCIPISDESLKKNNSMDINNHKDEEIDFQSDFDRTTTMTTSSYLDWSVLFLETVLKFIMKVAKVSVEGKKREIPPGMFLSETLELFFSQISDEIYDVILERLVLYFTKTFEPDYYKQLGNFLVSATFRDPKKSLKVFLPLFINKLISHHHKSSGSNSSGTILELSDQEYRWYITLLGYVIFKGGSELVNYKQMLMDSLSILMSSDNKVIIKSTSKVVRKLIFSLSRCYPLNNRSIPTNLLSKNENLIKYWGITDKSQILPVEWFEPKQPEIQFTRDLIERFLKVKVEELNSYIQSKSNGTHSNNNSNNNNGNGKSNSLFDRMKILNSLKSINNIIRTATYVIPDSKDIIELDENATLDGLRYNVNYVYPVHGKVQIEEFSKLKEEIYTTIHNLMVYLRTGNDEEISILCAISKSYQYLFYGKKDIQNQTTSSLFSKWKNLKKVNTRNTYVNRAYNWHLDRQYQHYYYQPMTNISKSAFLDLLDLSVHRFREVRKVAQNTLKNIIPRFPNSASKLVVPRLINNLIQQNSDQDVKGSIYLLSFKTIYKKVKENWSNIKQFVPLLLLPLDQKFKPTTRELFSEFKKKLIGVKYRPCLYIIKSTEILSLDNNNNSNSNSNESFSVIVPKEILEKSNKFIDNRNKSNLESLHFVVGSIINLLNQHDKKESVNWKEHIYLLGSLIYYEMLIFDSIPNIGFKSINLELLLKNSEVVKNGTFALIKNMVNDYPLTRMLSLNIISQVLNYENTKYLEYCHQGYWDNNNNSGIDNNRNEISLFYKTIIDFFKSDISNIFNESFIDKLIKLQLIDHDTEGLNHTVSVTLSNKSLSGYWPNTRYSVTVQYFKIPNAKLFCNLMSVLGDQTFEILKTHIETLKVKTTKEDLSLLSELISGIARFVSTGGLELDGNKNSDQIKSRSNEILSYISEVLLSVLSSYSNECIETYTTAIRFICHNLKYERVTWLSDILLKLYHSSSNISTLAKSIHFLRGMLYEISWKSKEFHQKLLEICLKEFSNPYKQIRSEASRLMIRVLNYQIQFQVSSVNGKFTLEPPKLPEKSQELVLNLVKELDNNELSVESKSSLKENLMSLIYCAQYKGFSNIFIRLLPSFIKPILSLAADTKREIMEGSGVTILAMSQIFVFSSSLINQVLEQLELSSKSTFWKVRKIVAPFLQIFFFNHSIYLSNEQIEKCFSLVTILVNDSQIEVREIAKSTLASMLISSDHDPKRIQNLIDESIKSLNSIGKTSPDNILQKHSCILILSAIVLSNPYQIPKYFPKVLDQLSRYSYSTPPLKTSVELTISDFWRTHKDSWEQEKLTFTEDEIEIIRSTKIAPCYYA